MVRRTKGDGSVSRQANGRWSGRFFYDDPVTGLRKRAQVTGSTKREVSAKLREMSRRLEAGLVARDDSMRFGAFAAQWIESSLAASERKATTKVLYGGLARTHILTSDLAKLPLRNVRPTSVERFVMQLKGKGLSESTVRQIYTVARAIGDDAVRGGLLAVNPLAAVRRPKVTRVEAAYLEPQQVDHLIRAAANSRYQPMFRLLSHTGLRRGEALALKWTDLDWDDRLIRVRGTLARVEGQLQVLQPKTTSSRRQIPMTESVYELLCDVRARTMEDRERASQLWVETGFVFVTEAGEPCDPRNALRALKAAAKRARLPGVGLHTLRHSAASVMLAERVPLNVVSEILGHAGIAITSDIYGHIAPSVSRGALDALSEALDRGLAASEIGSIGARSGTGSRDHKYAYKYASAEEAVSPGA